jgi:hypothetical protein
MTARPVDLRTEAHHAVPLGRRRHRPLPVGSRAADFQRAHSSLQAAYKASMRHGAAPAGSARSSHRTDAAGKRVDGPSSTWTRTWLHPSRTYVRMALHDQPHRSIGRRTMEGLTPTVVTRHRAHVARIYPTPAQRVVLDRQGHTARALWNLLHEWYTCRNGGIARRPSVAEVDRQLRAARTDPLPGWEWVAELPAQATQQVLRHYLRTWDRFYKGTANPPKPKKHNGRLAVDVPQASQLCVTRLGRRWGEVMIPLAGRIWGCPALTDRAGGSVRLPG